MPLKIIYTNPTIEQLRNDIHSLKKKLDSLPPDSPDVGNIATIIIGLEATLKEELAKERRK
jgi:hypothetical protein